MSTRAALRYSKAILDRAKEVSKEAGVFQDMQNILKTLEGSKELRDVLASPVVSEGDKGNILKEIFKGDSKIIINLFDMLVANNRASLLGEIAKGVIALYKEQQGVVVAKVTTALALTPAMSDKVNAKVKALTGKDKVSIEHVIDPSIIGGFILRVGDIQYDASISHQLKEAKKVIQQSN